MRAAAARSFFTEASFLLGEGVDLIDGDRLCDLLKEYELGVRRTIRQIEDVEVVPEFFADL